MKSRPILFNAAMVRALLDGSKTQTRCIIKLPHNNSLGVWEETTFGGKGGGRTKQGEEIPLQTAIWHTRTGDVIACPYGLIGDQLWVRETFTFESNLMDALPDYKPPFTDGRPIKYYDDECGDKNEILWVQPHYKATDRTPELYYENKQGPFCKWRPALFMPRWASRITLKITDIRIERLNDISEADAKAEGVQDYKNMFMRDISAYTNLWESINGVGSWIKNPYEWVINFKVGNDD